LRVEGAVTPDGEIVFPEAGEWRVRFRPVWPALERTYVVLIAEAV
jgi:hypothetical protein